MALYQVLFDPQAEKTLAKLDPTLRRMILKWIDKHLVGCSDPHAHGKALKGKYKGMWRYRIGDMRLLAQISQESITILILKIGHRGAVYK